MKVSSITQLSKLISRLPRAVLRTIPLPLFAVIVGLLAGWALWVVVDTAQKDAVRKIYDRQLQVNLDQRAREALIHYNYVVDNYSTTLQLLANHRRLANYLDPVYWFPDDTESPVIYIDEQPNWLPELSRWQMLASPSNILLLDTLHKLREEYRLLKEPLPEKFLHKLPDYVSTHGTMLVEVDGDTYLVVSTQAEDATHNVMGTLVMIVPIDRNFLASAQRGSQSNVITALVDARTQSILSSSDPRLIRKKSSLSEIDYFYAITTQSLPEHIGADSNLLFGTMIPRSSVSALRRTVVKLERRQRLIVALSFVTFFSLLFLLVSNRLSKALRRLSDFSQRALGVSHPETESGNQLLILEDWMKRFIDLVREAREDMRKQHAKEIRDKEALTRAIMETSIDSIVTANSDGNIIDFNPTAEKTFGYTEKEVVRTIQIDRLLAPESRVYFLNLFAECCASMEFQEARLDILALRADGSFFPVEIAIRPVELEDQMLFALYFHDVSERRSQEREIRALAAFPSESPTPMLRVNSLGVVTYANQASEHLLGFWGCGPMQTLPLNWRMRVEHVLEANDDQEIEIKTDKAVYSMLLAPIAELDYVNIYARDITEVRLAEEEARRRQNELVHVCRVSSMGEMATGLAHELNQPLTAIINYASGARRRFQRGANPDELITSLDHVTTQATRAAQIIKWLRGLVGRESQARQMVKVNDMIHEVLSFMDFEIRKAKLDVELNLAENLPDIYIGLVEVEQVILNLVRNAIDAISENDNAKEKGRLRVTTHQRHGKVEILIADNGPGITEDVKMHLFEPFFSTKNAGMGMGLAISQGILEEHEGNISVTDSWDLGGAVFCLSFPITVPEHRQIA